MIFLKTLMVVFCMQEVHSLQGNNNKPHIILMVADDLGWHDVSWHNQDVFSPNLRDLALGGVRLESSYVLPVCTPTRSALLTGRYPFTLGRQAHVIKPYHPTGLTLKAKLLPQALKAAGYSTHAVGKWHLGYCSWDYTPTYRGFDTFYGFYNGEVDYYRYKRLTLLDPSYKGDNEKKNIATRQHRRNERGRFLDLRNNTEPVTNQNGTYSTHMFASHIENLLESRNPADPMFLYLPFQSVHSPLMVPENYTEPYSHIKNNVRRTYLGMVTALDEAVGKIVNALKRTGHYENSVIVFTSDNGGDHNAGGNNWPLRGGKATLWEGGTRGVSFIHSPLLPNPGTISKNLIHVTDWFPTLVGLAGGEAPSNTDGFDQWKAIAGLEPSPRDRMVYNIDKIHKFRASVRIGDFKLMVGNFPVSRRIPPPEMRKRTKKSHKNLKKRYYVSRNILHPQIKGSSKARTYNSVFSLGKPSSLKSWKHENKNRHLGGRSGSTTWGFLLKNHFRGNEWLKKRPKVLKMLKTNTKIRLYHISDDPKETNDLSSERIDQVQTLLEFLADEISNRYVPADGEGFNPKSDPRYWNNIFTPGWCKSR